MMTQTHQWRYAHCLRTPLLLTLFLAGILSAPRNLTADCELPCCCPYTAICLEPPPEDCPDGLECEDKFGNPGECPPGDGGGGDPEPPDPDPELCIDKYGNPIMCPGGGEECENDPCCLESSNYNAAVAAAAYCLPKSRCGPCGTLKLTVSECYHENWPLGTPCLQNKCIVNTIHTATCTYRRNGIKLCDGDCILYPYIGPMATQKGYKNTTCHGGTVHYTERVRIYGCESGQCLATPLEFSCETPSCQGDLEIVVPRGSRNSCVPMTTPED